MKVDRLVSIIIVLLRRQRVQARDLADLFEVSVRTILRDIEAINLAGIPIVTYQGSGGGIAIADGYRLDRSVLNSDDMAALITGLRGVAATLPDHKLEVLLGKLRNTIPSSQVSDVNQKASQVFIDLTPWGNNEALTRMVDALRNAISQCREVTFEYLDSNNARTSRRVQPYTMVLKGQSWYLYAWCLKRQAFRLFKLFRMKELAVQETVFERRYVDMDSHPWDGDSSQGNLEMDLLIDPSMESMAVEWFGECALHLLDDGMLLAKAAMPENNWLYTFLLSFGPGLTVLHPPHLREKVAELALKTYQNYISVT